MSSANCVERAPLACHLSPGRFGAPGSAWPRPNLPISTVAGHGKLSTPPMPLVALPASVPPPLGEGGFKGTGPQGALRLSSGSEDPPRVMGTWWLTVFGYTTQGRLLRPARKRGPSSGGLTTSVTRTRGPRSEGWSPSPCSRPPPTSHLCLGPLSGRQAPAPQACQGPGWLVPYRAQSPSCYLLGHCGCHHP